MNLIATTLTLIALLLIAVDLWRCIRGGKFPTLIVIALILLSIIAFAP